MKIILTTTEFVKQMDIGYSWSYNHEERYDLIVNYANFISQPLKLEMFIPCDEDGNFKKKPQWTFENQDWIHEDEREYNEAKSKVLFEGWEYLGLDKQGNHKLFPNHSQESIDNYDVSKDYDYLTFIKSDIHTFLTDGDEECSHSYHTIEDLAGWEITKNCLKLLQL